MTAPDPAEAERVRRITADVLRSWLVEHDPLGGPVVPLEWLASELHTLIEARPYGDMRTTPGRYYTAGVRDALRLVYLAKDRQSVMPANEGDEARAAAVRAARGERRSES